MDVKIIAASKNEIEFLINNGHYIILQKGKKAQLIKIENQITHYHRISLRNTKKPQGSIYFTFDKDPEISVKSFFERLDIYLSMYEKVIKICHRIAHAEFDTYLEMYTDIKNFKVIDYLKKEEVRLHRQDEIIQCFDKVVKIKNGKIYQDKKIVISKYENSVKNLSTHEKLRHIDMDSINEDLDKVLKALEIK